MKKYTIELTKEQLEQLGLEVPKFELSEDFWKSRNTFNIDTSGLIVTEEKFYKNINEHEYEVELPTKDLAEAYKVWTRLMLIQYEMNGGEVLDKGYAVANAGSHGWCLYQKEMYLGIKFKTLDLARQFLQENIDDLNKINIMGF